MRVVAAVLKLSNLSFSPVNNIDGSEGCAVQNEYGQSNAVLILDIFCSNLLYNFQLLLSNAVQLFLFKSVISANFKYFLLIFAI